MGQRNTESNLSDSIDEFFEPMLGDALDDLLEAEEPKTSSKNRLAELRRRGEDFNILHAYHSRPEDRDNDLYLRLGTLKNPAEVIPASAAHRGDLETALRDVLAAHPITVELTHGALSVVEYTDPCLPQASTRSLDPRTLMSGESAADVASSDVQD